MNQSRHLPKLENFEPQDFSGEFLNRDDYNAADLNKEPITSGQLKVSWICRAIAAAIMLETLWFKFTGHPESVYIFSKLNMESWWRYGQGVWELIAAVLLLWPKTTWIGALLTLGAMGGAILSHLTVLGISVQDDHGILFGMACVTFLCGLTTLWIHQGSIPNIVRLDE
jgi:putative oxidoreductase